MTETQKTENEDTSNLKRKDRRTSWPDDRIRELKELTDSGLSANQIAERFGITRNAVIGAWNRNAAALGRHLRPRPNVSPPKKIKIIKSDSPTSMLVVKSGAIYRTKPPPISPSPTPTSVEPRTDTVPFIELTPSQCRYPMWGREKSTPEGLSCGRPKVFGSYCAEHHAITHDNSPLRRL